MSARPADQLAVSGNACGPAALLTAFRFGNEGWQRVAGAVAGGTDKEQITMIIRERGLRPSHHLKGKPRWGRHGVSVADLHDMGNEMAAGRLLPPLSQEVLFLKPGEDSAQLLRRTHDRLEASLRKGLPAVLSIRRYAYREEPAKPPGWTVLDGHFVTIVALPRKLPRGHHWFPVTYIDPWGGKMGEGAITVPRQPVLTDGGQSPCLEAAFPGVKVGTKGLRKGERSVVVVSAAIGRW